MIFQVWLTFKFFLLVWTVSVTTDFLWTPRTSKWQVQWCAYPSFSSFHGFKGYFVSPIHRPAHCPVLTVSNQKLDGGRPGDKDKAKEESFCYQFFPSLCRTIGWLICKSWPPLLPPPYRLFKVWQTYQLWVCLQYVCRIALILRIGERLVSSSYCLSSWATWNSIWSSVDTNSDFLKLFPFLWRFHSESKPKLEPKEGKLTLTTKLKNRAHVTAYAIPFDYRGRILAPFDENVTDISVWCHSITTAIIDDNVRTLSSSARVWVVFWLLAAWSRGDRG